MTIIILFGFCLSLFFIALLAGKSHKILIDKVFLSMFVVYALTIGGTYVELYNVENDYPFPHLMNINWLFLLLHGPLLWFYVKSLTLPEFKIKAVHLLHFAPFVFYTIFHSFNFISLSAEEKIFYIASGTLNTTILVKLGSLAIAVSTLGYNMVALILLRNHLRNVKNTFSNIEDKDLKWLKTLVIASLIIFSVNVLLYNLNNFLRFIDYFALAQVAYSFSTVYVFFIGYFGVRQGQIFMDNNPVPYKLNKNDVKKEANSILQRIDYSHIIGKLILLMEQEQPYLDPEITLAKLSAMLKVKPELLSEVLNSSLNQNFFDFINKYRIEEFKIKCLSKEYSHLSIMGIAYDCGFNSKAAFYRSFNKFEGSSPTAYMSKVSG